MLNTLSAGDSVITLRLIPDGMIQHWKFKNECRHQGASFAAGAVFKVIEVGKIPGNMWVKLAIPGSSPVRTIKVAGGEFAHNFRAG
ncbi:MAG: hypothetical protein ABIQ88_18290 [Chitinophagaceae bacterium]